MRESRMSDRRVAGAYFVKAAEGHLMKVRPKADQSEKVHYYADRAMLDAVAKRKASKK